MTTYRYSSALSYLVLAATGLYCLLNINNGFNGWTFPHHSFLLITFKALLGFWRWGNPAHGEKIIPFYRLVTAAQTIFSLPLINTTIWLNNGYNYYFATFQTFIGIIPFILYLTNKPQHDLNDLILVANTISLGCVSFMVNNYWGIAASLSFGYSYFCFIMDLSVFKEIPTIDLFNYSLAFFVYFAFKAVQDDM